MKSFDEWFNKSHAVKTAYSASYIVGSRKGYEAGQQSKQAEVDELRFQRDVLSNKVDELQKQIDEALKLLNLAYPESWAYCVDEAINILKGDQS